MKCPGCGESNDEGYRFCRNCGYALPAVATPLSSTSISDAPGSSEKTPTVPVAPVSEAPPTYKLLAIAGLLSGRTFTIGPPGLTIGRDPSTCQVVIADDEISRLHAWIGWNDEGEIVVRDRHSANGTYVNRVRVQEKVLRTTDEICFGSAGRHLFRIDVDSGPGGRKTGGKTATEEVRPVKPRADERGTSVLKRVEDTAAPQGGKAAGGTVVLKLTDLTARPHVELIVDRYAVRTLDIPDTGLAVGRDSDRCQLLIDHPSVSSIHAEFSPQDGKVLLIDRSTNGTFLNGQRVETAELHDGDYITFGRYASKSLIFKTGLESQLKIETVDLNKDRVTIGRDSSNDVVIDHPVVSKKHAEIVQRGGKAFLVDLGSTNGTFVNGIKVRRHPLQELDRIVIGPSELHFTSASLSHVPDKHVVRLDVQNVNFQVIDRYTGKHRHLLDDISLVVKPRELIGLLGPSGAGKSTLMNALNGLVKPTSGRILYNGANLYENLESLKSSIGFVPQEDIVHRQLTVRHCLYYAAKLRLPEDLSECEVNRRVEEMLDTLKIDREGWDNRVSTLSGGQRKRVSLGIELLSRPGVLFLDEPTAGLDPRTETLMMMLFRQLANQGSTIIITTHLLGSFGVLDKVLVLLQGRMAYYGPGAKFLEYFKAEAPPDVYDDLTDNNNVPYAQELKKRYEESSLHRDLIAEPLKTAVREKKAAPATAAASTVASRRGLSLHQLKALTRRNWELKFGDSAQTALLFLQAPLVALLVGLMASERNQIQTLFMAMFASLWFGCSNAVREVVDEQTIYRRERQTGLKIPSYVFSKLGVLSLVALAQCVSMVIILLGVNQALSLGPTEIVGAVGIMFLVAVNGTLIGLAISSLVNSPEKALTLFPLVLIPELLLSGLFLPVDKITPIIQVSVEQLLEGKMFAQPEAIRKLQRTMNPPGAVPEAPASSAPRADAQAEATARKGEFAHQVVGAVTPSPQVEKVFHKYTPQPVAGMSTVVRWLSVVAVSRWGLEALSDLCVHGAHSTQDYAYKIINTIFISLHPNDQRRLEAGLEAPAEAFLAAQTLPLPSAFWSDKGPYLGILSGFAVLTTGVVLFLIKKKDAG